MKHLFSLLAILVAAVYTWASDDIHFTHLTTKDGLSDNEINSVSRDSRGFMWISTAYGLCRYDGYSFKNFVKDDSHGSLPFYSVGKIQEDASGNIWISTNSQRYAYFDTRKEAFIMAETVLAEKYGLQVNPKILFVDSKKHLWIDTGSDVMFHYDIETNKTEKIPHIYREATVTDICEDRTGIVRVYSDGHVDHIDRTSGRQDFSTGHISQHRLRNWSNYNIYCDYDGDYWVYSFHEAWLYRKQTGEWINLTDSSSPIRLNGKSIRDITTNRDRNIWVAVDNGGINIVDKKNGKVRYITNNILDKTSLSHNGVSCIYADNEGGVWVGTHKHGVSYYNKGLFKFQSDNFPEFTNTAGFNPGVSSISETPSGNLLLGIYNGLIEIDQNSGKKNLTLFSRHTHPSSEGYVIISMVTDSNGTTWMGTYNYGLVSYDGKNLRHHTLNPERPGSMANKTVWSLALDSSGYLWIGTWGNGLYGYDPSTGTAINYNENFKNDQITSVCVSRDKKIYMGTTYGLLIYDPMSKKFKKLTREDNTSNTLTNTAISHVYEDSRGLLWISTRHGLNVYDRKDDRISRPVKALEKTIIHASTEDNDKNIWVTTSTGIHQIVVNGDPATQSYSFSHRKFDDMNIHDNIDFNDQSILRQSSGKIIAGGSGGMCIIDPRDILLDTTSPQVHFTSLRLFNNDIMIDSVYDGNKVMDMAPDYVDAIHLNHDQNVFTVYFSAMNYMFPEKTTYLYKLEGFDTDWRKSDSNRLTYTNLASGKYILKVRAVNNEGYASEKTAELKIIIAPPFYRSWVAYVIYFLLFILLVILLRIYMRHNEQQKYALLKIKQEAQQKREIDDMKMRFFTNISHDLRTPLTLILTPIEYVMSHTSDTEHREKLEIARNNAVRLLGMVNQLLDFRKSDVAGHTLNLTTADIVDTAGTICNNFAEYSGQHNINLTFYSAIPRLYCRFDEDKISKILMNLLSNAFKFTPDGGRVDVSIDIVPQSDTQPEMLQLKVADNGCGISDEHKELIFDRFYQIHSSDGRQSGGSGVGLNLVKEFATLHGGAVSVRDNIGKGSVFIVEIPLVRVEETPVEQQSPAETVSETEDNDKNVENSRPVVLIVDDNDEFRRFMKDCLKKDYIVHEAEDGLKAWKIIPELQPDIVVSDVMMPNIDGNELCHKVKNDIRTSHILMILLTARAAKEHELAGLENGADDYITKPFNLSIFTRRIKNLLQRRHESHSQPMEIEPSKVNITPLDQKLMQKAVNYVEENIDRSELSVEELSSELGMSRVHLYKKMVSITGKTPKEFIRIIRLKRAAQLLAESQLSIAEITYQTGFNNLSLFRKYFKNEFGLLPSEYQAKHGRKYNESI